MGRKIKENIKNQKQIGLMERHKMREAYIKFIGPIESTTVFDLEQKIKEKIADGVNQIHLIILTPMYGSPYLAIDAYNFLMAQQININTYASYGDPQFNSSGIVLFCSGRKRFSEKNIRYGLQLNIGNFEPKRTLYKQDFEEKLASFRIDTENIASVIADTTGKPIKDIIGDIEGKRILNTEEAKKYGLIHEIGPLVIPDKADFSVICNN